MLSIQDAVDPLRIGACNQAPINPKGKYVLYWMTQARRLTHNPSLDLAIARCNELKKPLLIFEPMQVNYRFACERHQRFVLDGMQSQKAGCDAAKISYLPLLEAEPGQVRAALLDLCKQATCVVGDLHPGGWLNAVTRKAVQSLSVHTTLVDAVGLVPLAMAQKNYLRAYDYRRFIAKELPVVLRAFPRKLKLDQDLLQGAVISKGSSWQSAAMLTQSLLSDPQDLAKALSLSGPLATNFRGGHQEARARWQRFLEGPLALYSEQRHHPDAQVESRQAPFLHYGQMSAHELLEGLLAQEGLDLGQWAQAVPKALADKSSRWGLTPGADGFVDQLLVWRELGQHLAYRRPNDYEHYRVLPEWAQKSLQEHSGDPREALVSMEDLHAGNSPDPVWNAAQNQLRQEGHIHNYLRMLWGKRVLAWSKTPQEAFERLVILNNQYALDGRDPNSHAGIGWIFGLFDRPWGPERPIYGKIRYMTTQSTLRKLRLKGYLQQYGTPNTVQQPRLF